MPDIHHADPGNIDKYFKGQQKHEELLTAFRKHWVVLLPPTFGFVLLTGVFLFMLWYVNTYPPEGIGAIWYYQIVTFIIVLVTTFFFHQYFNRLLNYYLDIVILTNYRIICLHKSLFLQDEKIAIDLHEIQDIRKSQQGIIKNLLNYGELIITLSGINMVTSITHVPRPDKYFRAINLGKRNYILTRRSHKELEMGPPVAKPPSIEPIETTTEGRGMKQEL